MQLSIIIPTLNEESGISACLAALQPLREHVEIIIADGGSRDNTRALAAPLADQLINASLGRARQMNAGAAHARSDILLFLHADTLLPQQALHSISRGIAEGFHWGRFDIHLKGHSPLFKVIAQMMNWRSRLTGISTGDQGLFVTRKAFNTIGCYPEIALMEDIAICSRLKEIGPPYCIREKVISSGRRWEQFGIIKTILLMWWLRLRYFFGSNAEALALLYSRGKFWKR